MYETPRERRARMLTPNAGVRPETSRPELACSCTVPLSSGHVADRDVTKPSPLGRDP